MHKEIEILQMISTERAEKGKVNGLLFSAPALRSPPPFPSVNYVALQLTTPSRLPTFVNTGSVPLREMIFGDGNRVSQRFFIMVRGKPPKKKKK